MKKTILILTILLMMILLAACGKTNNATETTSETTDLSATAEILLGTFQLEGTDLEVTPEQAKQLLPLWQMLQSLSTSSTAASEEIEAVEAQIKSTMTTAQIEAIQGMQLTQEDLMTLMRENMGSAQGTGDATRMAPSGDAGDGNPSFGGEPPSGNIPAGGGNMPAGGMRAGSGSPPEGFVPGDISGTGGNVPGISTTPQAVPSNGLSTQLPPPLLNALIDLLKQKLQS